MHGAGAYLNNDGDGAIIKNAEGNVLDETPILNDNSNTAETWQRIPDAWGEWKFTLETEEQSNRILKVYINEYEVNPKGKDAGNEWVELYNPNDVPIDISNLELWDQIPGQRIKQISENTVIPPHGYLVISWRGAKLNNDGDGLILKKEDRIYDQTPIRADNDNNEYTWQRVPDGSSNWQFKPETPSRANS